VVRERNFLDLRPKVENPIVLVERDTRAPSDRSAGDRSKPDGEHGDEPAPPPLPDTNPDDLAASSLTHPHGRFGPIVLRCHGKHGDDLRAAREALESMFLQWDLMEPFERIALALQAVHEQNPKD